MTNCRSAQTLACVALTALLAVGSFAGSAAAGWGNDNDRHDARQNGNRNHYQAPPVVYDRYTTAPAYYAPPVVYGTGYDSGFNLNINIQ
jgi:hypothetical protein